MTDTPPSPQIQREIIQVEIASNKQTYWLTSLRAKSFKKAGMDDLAKTNAELAAKLEAYITLLEDELSSITE